MGTGLHSYYHWTGRGDGQFVLPGSPDDETWQGGQGRHDEVDGLDVGTNDAASNGLPSSFTSSSLSVARVTFTEEQSNSSGEEDA